MKPNYTIAGLLPFLFVIAGIDNTSIAAGTFDDFNIYYINGVANDPPTAESSKKALHDFVVPDASIGNVDKLYNSSVNIVADLLETYRLAEVDKEYTNFWKWLDKPNAAPEWYRSIHYSTLAKYNEAAYANNPDFQLMVSKIKAKAQLRKKTILVAHSEGNFFANMIANHLRSTDPELAACVGIVGVATPATYVSGGGPYTTLVNDFVINNARSAFPWGAEILPPSPVDPVYSGKHGQLGHEFVTSYIAHPLLTPRIRGQVLDVVAKINETCKASSCGTPIESYGSSGITEEVLSIGNTAQNVTANFDAYTIPDKLELFANGTRLAATAGMESGYRSFSFNFDPKQLGTTQLIARVTGNSDTGTRWNLCVDCNGATCPSVIQPRNIFISLSYAWSSSWVCSTGTAMIDTRDIGTLTGQAQITASVTSTRSPERHTFFAPNAGCVCTQLSCYTDPKPILTFNYKDGSGNGQFFQVPLTKEFQFDIK